MKKTKVNLGSGYKREEGFITVDFDPLTSPDIQMDITKDIFPLEDSSIEEVRAYHILEHLPLQGIFHLFKELYRICKDQAVLEVKVPHHRSEIFFGDISHVTPITIDNMRQFSKEYNKWHIDQWQSSSGFGLKLDVDFEIVDFEFIVDGFWKERFKEMNQEQINEVSRNFNNVYGETWMTLVVIKKNESN